MPKTLDAGDKAPAFHLPATGDKKVRLSDHKGEYVILYFYPKDHTPGCTTEGQDFAALHNRLRRRGARVFGISRDSVATHENFKAKQKYPFDLLADTDEKACKSYDVIRMKNMYGKQVRGIERSTFLIDPKGIVRQVWRKVRVAGHAEAVLAALDALQKS